MSTPEEQLSAGLSAAPEVVEPDLSAATPAVADVDDLQAQIAELQAKQAELIAAQAPPAPEPEQPPHNPEPQLSEGVAADVKGAVHALHERLAVIEAQLGL